MEELVQPQFCPDDARRGKLGIALSGGGFRAALFHVGVLATLAERDLLRHVSIISTVSGGSIIGAFYYLKLKQLLEGDRDDQLRPDAKGFRVLVSELEVEFRKAQQHNLRLMTFADGRENARMLSDKISSTTRLADLFNTYFYAPITGDSENPLADLSIHSVFESCEEDPEASFAIPKLIVNATALNTGHLFQLTSDFIGEFPTTADMGGLGSIPVLPRLSFRDASLSAGQKASLSRISIAEAVAASCCVPGLLDPLSLSGLYCDDAGEDVVVRLVDGGVFDNQGLVSLKEGGCTHFICSDASDLLGWQARPDERIHNVAMRANEIMMDRIRCELLDQLAQVGPENYLVFTLGEPLESAASTAEKRLATLLASIRTDLDAFSDLEAFALMDYGYRLSAEKLASVDSSETPDGLSGVSDCNSTDTSAEAVAETLAESVTGSATVAPWTFTAIRDLYEHEEGRQRLFLALSVGSHQFLKVFYLGEFLPYAILVLPMIIPIALLGILVYMLPPVPTQAWVALGLVGLVGIAFSQNARIVERLDQVPILKRFRKRLAVLLRPLGVTVALGMFAAAVTRVNLRVFHPLFLKYGSYRDSSGD